jgi:hypothetical protein
VDLLELADGGLVGDDEIHHDPIGLAVAEEDPKAFAPIDFNRGDQEPHERILAEIDFHWIELR